MPRKQMIMPKLHFLFILSVSVSFGFFFFSHSYQGFANIDLKKIQVRFTLNPGFFSLRISENPSNGSIVKFEKKSPYSLRNFNFFPPRVDYYVTGGKRDLVCTISISFVILFFILLFFFILIIIKLNRQRF